MRVCRAPQRCLLDSAAATLPALHWLRVFNVLVLPLVSHVVDSTAALRASQSPGPRGAAGGLNGKALIGVVGLLSKAFLHHVTTLATLPAFHELYVEVLRVCERVHTVGQGLSRVPQTVVEVVRNVVLVMEAEGLYQVRALCALQSALLVACAVSLCCSTAPHTWAAAV